MKRCRTLGIDPSVMGYHKTSNRHAAKTFKKRSDYANHLNEKQKVRFIYGVLEKQFRHYYDMAAKKQGVTGENLLQILESRLDNVVYRLGFAATRREARQMVTHARVTLNGKKVDVPSILVRPGDVVALTEKSKGSNRTKEVLEQNAVYTVPAWLDLDRNTMSAKVVKLSSREDIDFEVDEQLIVELYSK
jgi:small subunit ribosomal protein S4